jgi:hypothetical protein
MYTYKESMARLQSLWDNAGEGSLEKLTGPVFESYRLSVVCTWGRHKIIRADHLHNEDFEHIQSKRPFTPSGRYREFPQDPMGSFPPSDPTYLSLKADRWKAHPGALLATGWNWLDRYRWEILKTLLQTSGFWELPETRERGECYDGEGWILEANEGGRYHRVYRWCHENESEMMCLPFRYLLDLAEIAFWEAAEREKGEF